MNEEFILSFIINNIKNIDKLVNKRSKIGIVFKTFYSILSNINIPYLVSLIDKNTDLIDIYIFDLLSNAIIARQLGIKKKIILLYYIDPKSVQFAIDNDIEITCPNIEWLNLVLHQEKINTSKNKLKLHIYYDSNLGREGINDETKLYTLLNEINKYKNIEIVGLGTKFNPTKEILLNNIKNIEINIRNKILVESISDQINKFNSIVKNCKDNKLIDNNTKIHAASSLEIFSNYQDTYYDFVRVGSLAFKTIFNNFLEKRIILDIKKIPINKCIGYFCKKITDKDITVAYIENPKIKNAVFKFNNNILNPIATSLTFNPYLLDITNFNNIKIGNTIDVDSNNIT